MKSIKGQTALITGGAKRLGRSIALELASQGADLAIHYHRSQAEAEATAEEARAFGIKAITVRADLSSQESATALFDQASKAVGPIDILINNASVFEPANLFSFSEAELAANIRLHATVPLELARCLAASERPGVIINLLDTRIARPDATYAPYSLSKCMLADLTRMLARELAPRIRVNAVAPGLILAPEGKSADVMQERSKHLPLQTVGEADDISAAVLFLLCSTFITGVILYVDGGSHLRGTPHA